MVDYSDQSRPSQHGQGTPPRVRQGRLSLDRRLFIKGMASAVPAVLTVRSGAALAASTLLECGNDAGTVDGNAVRVADTVGASEPADVGTRPVTSRRYTREVLIDDGGTPGDTTDDEYRTDVVWTYEDLDDGNWYIAQSYSLVNGVRVADGPGLPTPGDLASNYNLDFSWNLVGTFDASNPQAWAVVYVENDPGATELRVDSVSVQSGYPVGTQQLQVSAACLASMAALGITVDD